ncbi:MAG: TrmH family RNA methyltransferase [Parvularculaceae bacterium]|nr:TrmH family RNA methyltransferase [Parvularculaceae bacterium]
MRVVLYQPEIAGNVGAAIRAAACFGAGVDIVEPCGFPPDDRTLRRAAMDYGALAAPVRHASWAGFLGSRQDAGRLILLTTKAAASIWETALADADFFVIGQESAGAPLEVRDACDLAVRIPIAAAARSLNAATAAAIALAEARRQTGWRRTPK